MRNFPITQTVSSSQHFLRPLSAITKETTMNQLVKIFKFKDKVPETFDEKISVLEFNMNCVHCVTKVVSICKQEKGVENAFLLVQNGKRARVRVKGAFDVKKLCSKIWTKASKRVEIVGEENVDHEIWFDTSNILFDTFQTELQEENLENKNIIIDVDGEQYPKDKDTIIEVVDDGEQRPKDTIINVDG